jgi:hypothetical protein
MSVWIRKLTKEQRRPTEAGQMAFQKVIPGNKGTDHFVK